jgi:hypothetical protein
MGGFKKMVTVSNHAGQVAEGQKPGRKRICSRLLVVVGLGAMVLTVLGFLPGCGSDSTPGGAVKGKSAKPAARAEGVKAQTPAALVLDQAGMAPEKVQKQPGSQRVEVFPGLTREVLEAKMAESRKNQLAMRQEVFPGITKEELDAKIAADRQKHISMRQEVFPGITKEELESRIATNRQKHDPRQMTLPGAGTQKEVDYNAARQQVKPGDRQLLPPTGGK